MGIKVNCCVVGEGMTNCYLLKNLDTQEIILVDPGAGPGRIKKAVELMGGTVRGILITHAHYDHIQAVPQLRADFGVPVYACEAERESLLDPEANLTNYTGKPLSLKADRYLTDGERFTLGGLELLCLHTPGHTAGGCVYAVEGESVLFAGDTLFKGSIGRADLPGGNMETLLESVRKLYRTFPEGMVVYCGHFGPTTIGEEMRNNPYVRDCD